MSTMRDVASRAGVSAKTVSRVMNEDRYVSEDVRTRVMAAVRELNYVPNSLARTFRSGRDAAIGIAVPDISDSFFSQVAHAVEQAARTRGAAVFVTSLGDNPAYERPAVEALLGRQIIGLILAPVAVDQSYLEPWQDRTALVFIDRQPSRLTADSVLEDDFGGARDAVAHLVGHGHRRIAFVGDSHLVPTTARRLDGYHAALRAAGLTADPDLVPPVLSAHRPDFATTVPGLLALPDPPTAMFCSNARSSLEVLPLLHELGRSDIAFISFGDFPLADTIVPPVTVVDQDPVGLGRFAAKHLFHRVDEPHRRVTGETVLPVQLVLRGSCGSDHAADLRLGVG
ncbi:LacI family DNA-binding transcriptional regulator [Nakamurella flavida]|uniref:LacI family DNA-binding transcriptional regulator n=1 Tax=Nakamurella flavida TaxID=363630 RepID=A0A938YJ22_9ACTN|nr:LacI family DNA-binding transcriptional regulator [Nakamurella flavida]MBM9475401.1 LacI family DNA-binding transcriptional regulator [Nakamurella flavida]MBM9475511.1 LacI family DNA-binding transcriptional regulator [Nakamurella flavida]MDP9776981.1 LacI family transcriptional regulator [Nakamurella flavida]